MLTDVFAYRYSGARIWDNFGTPESRLLIQLFRIVREQLYPYTEYREVNDSVEEIWEELHSRLSMELGTRELSSRIFSYPQVWNGKTTYVSHTHPWSKVCENFVCKAFTLDSEEPDVFLKNRLSLIELAFRKRHDKLQMANSTLPKRVEEARKKATFSRSAQSLRIPVDRAKALVAINEGENFEFRQITNELNVRFRQAGCPLNYHNGFIQISDDSLLSREVEEPFWQLVSRDRWKNVDKDMKEAIDRRDSSATDAAVYAAKALESTIKIISDEMSVTSGRERGASNYIDNLACKRSGYFVANWEAKFLKQFFLELRNPLSHGSGSEAAIVLSAVQSNWIIGCAMAWIRSLIVRM